VAGVTGVLPAEALLRREREAFGRRKEITMAGINLGPDFERDVASLAGIDHDSIDPGTLDIALLNPGGNTTVRFKVHTDVSTPDLQALIQQYASPDGQLT